MLAACAARLAGRQNMIWVDLGGGTGVRESFCVLCGVWGLTGEIDAWNP